jgi:hypothetical protein
MKTIKVTTFVTLLIIALFPNNVLAIDQKDTLLTLFNATRAQMYANSLSEVSKLLDSEIEVDIAKIHEALKILNYLKDKRCLTVLLKIVERKEPIKILPGTLATGIDPIWGIKQSIKRILTNIADESNLAEIKKSKNNIQSRLERNDIDELIKIILQRTRTRKTNNIIKKLKNAKGERIKVELNNTYRIESELLNEQRYDPAKVLPIVYNIALTNQDTETRILAVKVLTSVGFHNAIPYLLPMMYDPNKDVRIAVVKQIGYLGLLKDKSVIPILEYLISNDSDKDIKDAAISEFEKINLNDEGLLNN